MLPTFLAAAGIFLMATRLALGLAQCGDRPGKTGDGEHRKPEDLAPQCERRPSDLQDFHRDLGRNFKALFSRENLLPLLIGLGSAAALSPVDDETAGYFLGSNDFPDLEQAGDILLYAELAAAGTGALLLLGESAKDTKFRQMSYSLAQALVLNNALTFAVKPAANRARPNRASQFSFPSAHASNAFAFSAVVHHHYGNKWGIPAYVLAVFISLARLEGNEHFMSDTIAGAALGYLVGRSVVRQAAPPRARRFVWTPLLSPARREAGLMFQFSVE